MEASNIMTLNMEGYESFSNISYLSKQKFLSILVKLKKRLSKPILVKLESLVEEELIWRLTISWYWILTNMIHFQFDWLRQQKPFRGDKMETKKTYLSEIEDMSSWGFNMEAKNIFILRTEGNQYFSNFYYLILQKSQCILGELRWRLKSYSYKIGVYSGRWADMEASIVLIWT